MHLGFLSLVIALVTAGLLMLPSELWADEDLSTKRASCQMEARERIRPLRAGSIELVQITIDSRQAYVRECMGRAPADPVSTGALRELINATTGTSKGALPRQR
jgi:hypothetical protein